MFCDMPGRSYTGKDDDDDDDDDDDSYFCIANSF
jgi:hypothetical protein